jgi:hypothetical protein
VTYTVDNPLFETIYRNKMARKKKVTGPKRKEFYEVFENRTGCFSDLAAMNI